MPNQTDKTNNNDIDSNCSVLILGGCRSGKSAYAEKLVTEYSRKTYVATMEAGDDELSARIALHQERRGREWKLVEEPISLSKVILENYKATDLFLIDCMTMWLSNMLMADCTDEAIERQVEKLIQTISQCQVAVIFVANEVGLGIVPSTPSGRRFRDLAGWTNQQLATICDDVYFVAAGCPLKLK